MGYITKKGLSDYPTNGDVTKSWGKYIEVASNVAVLVVAMALLGALVSTFWSRSANVRFEPGLQQRQALAPLPSIDYSSARRTLIIGLSTTCNYCTESLPFYKRILAALEPTAAEKATAIVAVFPNAKTEVEDYKQRNKLNVESIAAFNYSALGITGTPTLILVDSNGHVVNFWVGKLSNAEEQQVLDTLTSK